MSLVRQVRSWTGGIGLWRKIAIALAAAALAVYPETQWMAAIGM